VYYLNSLTRKIFSYGPSKVPSSLKSPVLCPQVINYEKDKRVNVSVQQDGSETTCTLTVEKAALEHSGPYRCAPSNADTAEITVHIFKGGELVHTGNFGDEAEILHSMKTDVA